MDTRLDRVTFSTNYSYEVLLIYLLPLTIQFYDEMCWSMIKDGRGFTLDNTSQVYKANRHRHKNA